MKVQRFTRVIVFGIVAGLLLSACVPAPPPAAPAAPTAAPADTPAPPPAAAEKTTVTCWWGGGIDPGTVAAVNQAMDLYMKDHPNIQVEMTFYNYEDYSNAMPAALAAGNPPDFSFGDPTAPNIPNYVAAGQLVELTEIIKERGWEEKLQSGVITFYDPLYGDKTYGIPLAMALRGIFYNKKILEEVGAGVPQTLPEFEALLEQVKAKGYTPLGMGNADKYGADYYWESLMLLYLANEDWQAFKRGTMTWQPGVPWGGEAVRQAMTKFMEWVDKGYFNSDYASITSDDVHAQFAQGKMFAYAQGVNDNANLLADNLDFEVGFMNWPRVYPDKPLLTMSDPWWLLILPKDSRHPEEALAIMDWLLSPEVGKIFAEQGLFVLHKINLDDVKVPIPWMDDQLAAITDQTMMGWINYMPPYEFPDRQGSELQKLLAGETDLDQYMKFMQETYDQAIAGSK